MKLPQLTPAEQREGAALSAAVRQRPAYHLLRAWLDIQKPAKTEKPTTTVGWLCNIFETHTGAALDETTAWVALEDAGYQLRPVSGNSFKIKRDTPAAEVNIDEVFLLNVMRDHHRGGGGGQRPSDRLKLWGDSQPETRQ